MSVLFTLHDHRQLLAMHSPPCVSIYAPTERAHPASQQNPIRYRNLLKQAEEVLLKDHRGRAKELLEKLRRLDEGSFWAGQRQGLAAFVSPDIFLHYRLPVTVPELAVVAETFHTRPLLKCLGSGLSYHLLAIAQKHVTLYDGWREDLDRVEVPGLPGKIEDVVGEVEYGPALSLHTVKPGGAGAIFHATGERKPDMKVELKKFFRAVDEKVCRHLNESHRPVVLAAQVHYQPIYREATSLKTLLPEGIVCDPEHLPAADLGRRAWKEVERRERERIGALFERFEEAQSKKHGSADLRLVARNAAAGRVEVLLLEEGRPVWGKLDRSSGEVVAAEPEKSSRDADLMDELAELVIERHGEVVLVEGDSFPSPTGLAAIYRY